MIYTKTTVTLIRTVGSKKLIIRLINLKIKMNTAHAQKKLKEVNDIIVMYPEKAKKNFDQINTKSLRKIYEERFLIDLEITKVKLALALGNLHIIESTVQNCFLLFSKDRFTKDQLAELYIFHMQSFNLQGDVEKLELLLKEYSIFFQGVTNPKFKEKFSYIQFSLFKLNGEKRKSINLIKELIDKSNDSVKKLSYQNNLAAAYIENADLIEAEELYKKIIPQLKNKNLHLSLIHAHMNLSMIYNLNKVYTTALEHLILAEQYALVYGFESLTFQIYQSQSEIYATNQNYPLAFIFSKLVFSYVTEKKLKSDFAAKAILHFLELSMELNKNRTEIKQILSENIDWILKIDQYKYSVRCSKIQENYLN